MPWNKEDRAFKILINRRVTSTAAYYEEDGDNTLDISFNEVKTQNIPFNNPALAVTNAVAKMYTLFELTPDPDVGIAGTASQQSFYAADAADATATPNDFRLRDWIGEKYGKQYRLKLYSNADIEIGISECEWFFDYVTGILTINGNPPNYPKPFKVSGWRYIGDKGGRVNGHIGQKPIHDTAFFPNNEAGANNRVPVYVTANNRYELLEMPTVSQTDLIIITKIIIATVSQTSFVVDSDIKKIVYVAIDGILLEASVSLPRTVTLPPVGGGATVVIKYFETLRATLVSTGTEDPNPIVFLFDVAQVGYTVSHLAPLRYSDSIALVENNTGTVIITSNEIGGISLNLTVTYDGDTGTFAVTNIEPSIESSNTYTAKLIGGGGGGGSKEEFTGSILAGNTIELPILATGTKRKDFTVVNAIFDFAYVSPNPYEITTITNTSVNCIIRICVSAGVQLKFINNAQLRTEGGLAATINGSNGDWIEFINKSGVLYQNNIGTYQ